MKIENVKVALLEDSDSDTSFLGEFTDDFEPGVMLASTWDFPRYHFGEPQGIPERGRHYRFFKPYAGGEKPGSRLYRKYAKQDAERMRGLCNNLWAFVGVQATATVSYPIGNGSARLETLRSGGLWGIESDAGSYLKEVAQEELADLRGHLEHFGIKARDEAWEALKERALEKADF
jgi:hypothetical protein